MWEEEKSWGPEGEGEWERGGRMVVRVLVVVLRKYQLHR